MAKKKNGLVKWLVITLLTGALLIGLRNYRSGDLDDLFDQINVAVSERFVSHDQNAPYKINVTFNHLDGIYQVGDDIQFSIKLNRPSYIAATYLNAAGKVQALIPPLSRMKNQIVTIEDLPSVSPGQRYTFPAPDSRLKFTATNPGSSGLVTVYASQEPAFILGVLHQKEPISMRQLSINSDAEQTFIVSQFPISVR